MQRIISYTVIAILASLFFFPFLGHVNLFDWDEINFAECAREMIVSKDYLRMQINFHPFWEKPPLFIWMEVLSMKVFGVNEFAARFPNAFMGVVTLMTLYYTGKKVANEKIARWWVALYAATWLPHFYFKSGIIDPTFNFFIFLSFFQFHLLRFSQRKNIHALLTGLFLGLAVLTKGPAAILIAALSFAVYLVVNKGKTGYAVKHLLIVFLSLIVTVSLWFGVEILNHGFWFVKEFIKYQVRLFSTEDSDHGGPFYYHFIVLLVGCFPASVFLFQYGKKRYSDNTNTRDFTRWMWILFWVVLILFSIVQTKIVHYSSLCYFPLTYLAAIQLYRLSTEQQKLKAVVKFFFIFIGFLLGILILLLPVIGIYKNGLIPYIQDPFAVGCLQANVSWSYSECLWGALYIVGIIIAFVWMNNNFRRGVIFLFALQVLLIQITVLHFTPKVEAYSQRAAIDFFKTFQGKDVNIQVLGYKSYAQLFYAKKMGPTEMPSNYCDTVAHDCEEKYLLLEPLNKPTYFICKIQGAKEYDALPQLMEIGRKNGFVFFKRK